MSTRDRILHAAAELFYDVGYHATGVDDIGDRASLTGPGIYRHFSGKQAILDTLLLTELERILEEARAITAADKPPREGLADLVQHRIDIALGPRSHLAPIFQTEERHASPDCRTRLQHLRRAYHDEWLRLYVLAVPTVPIAEARFAIHAVTVLIGYGALPELRGAPMPNQALAPDELAKQLARMADAILFP